MAETSAKLTAQQIVAIEALMACETRKEAAAVAGCGERTLHRWMAENEDFQLELERRTATIGRAIRPLLTARVVDYLERLDEMARDPDTPASVRAHIMLSLLARVMPDRVDGPQTASLDVGDSETAAT